VSLAVRFRHWEQFDFPVWQEPLFHVLEERAIAVDSGRYRNAVPLCLLRALSRGHSFCEVNWCIVCGPFANRRSSEMAFSASFGNVHFREVGQESESGMFDFPQHVIQDIENCPRGRRNWGNRFDIESTGENFSKRPFICRNWSEREDEVWQFLESWISDWWIRWLTQVIIRVRDKIFGWLKLNELVWRLARSMSIL
jgi:hypothetical protein